MVFVALTLTWLLETALAVSVLMQRQLSMFWQDDGDDVPSLLPVQQWQGWRCLLFAYFPFALAPSGTRLDLT